MAQTVTLPSGKTVNLRPTNAVTERQRRPLVELRSRLASNSAFVDAAQKYEANKKLTKAEEEALQANLSHIWDAVTEMGDRLIICAVESWTYLFDVNYDNLLDISALDLDKLREIAAPYMSELMPDFSVSRDQNSPTSV